MKGAEIVIQELSKLSMVLEAGIEENLCDLLMMLNDEAGIATFSVL